MAIIKHIKLGLTDYCDAWSMQEELFQHIINLKKLYKDAIPESQRVNYLISCEHDHIYTIGRGAKNSDLLVKESALSQDKIPYLEVNRGGKITYHGPGQIMLYFIFDLELFFKDINKFLRSLENIVILTLQDFDIKAKTIQGLTGVWVTDVDKRDKKICSIGIRTSRWVTMHGLCLNINPDMKYFDNIYSCGMHEIEQTSMQLLSKNKIDSELVISSLIKNSENIFSDSVLSNPRPI